MLAVTDGPGNGLELRWANVDQVGGLLGAGAPLQQPLREVRSLSQFRDCHLDPGGWEHSGLHLAVPCDMSATNKLALRALYVLSHQAVTWCCRRMLRTVRHGTRARSSQTTRVRCGLRRVGSLTGV